MGAALQRLDERRHARGVASRVARCGGEGLARDRAPPEIGVAAATVEGFFHAILDAFATDDVDLEGGAAGKRDPRRRRHAAVQRLW